MNALDPLLQRPDLWRGDRGPIAARPGVPTGHAALDRLLAGGGWPRGAVIEILADGPAHGGLGLLLPALAGLAGEGRWVVLVAPPFVPYPPALVAAELDLGRLLSVRAPTQEATLWALEQALRSGGCGAALAWPDRPPAVALRRLQLAAKAGDALAVLFLPTAAAAQPSPAALRLGVQPRGDGREVAVLRQRGGWPGGPLWLPA
jgi:hypothetical protein